MGLRLKVLSQTHIYSLIDCLSTHIDESHLWLLHGYNILEDWVTHKHINWYEVDLDLALLKGTSHAKWLKLKGVCVFLCGMDHTNWVWHNLGFMTETRCVCVCQRSVLRGGAQSLEILSHMQSGGNGVCFVRVCVCCYHLGKSLFCHVIGKHPLHSIGGLMSYDGIRCRGKLFWHVCVFLLCSESRLHAA